MLDDNGKIKIDSGFSHDQIEEVHKNILKNINDVKTIEVTLDKPLQSSALLTLLLTIKKEKPDISIPFVENKSGILPGLGNFVIMGNNNDV